MRIRTTGLGVLAVAVGVAAVATLGAGTAAAHGMITSGEITNQTIRGWDVHGNAVGSSELRGAGDGRGAAVNSFHIREGAVKSYQVKAGSVHWYDIHRGTIGPYRLNEELRGDISEPVVQSSYPLTEIGDTLPRAWMVRVTNVADHDIIVETHVVCDTGSAHKANKVSETVPANQTEPQHVRVECPDGSVAVGGGYHILKSG